jgi:NADH/NAD ratio-sensing transcriptional regulator Rex
MCYLLRTAGIKVKAFLEVNERQIGNQIDGIPILDSGKLSQFFGRAVMIGAVGQKGAREQIRTLADDCGWLEGKDFFCVA